MMEASASSEISVVGPLSPDKVRFLRAAVLMIFLGLLCELVAMISLNPATFMLFAVVGAPLTLAGVGLYLVHVVRRMIDKRAL